MNPPTQSASQSSQASQSTSKNPIIQPSIVHVSCIKWNSQKINTFSPTFHYIVINNNPIAYPFISNSPNKPHLTKRFSACHINPTSLCKNIDLCRSHFVKSSYDLIAVSETWFTLKFTDKIAKVNLYNLIRNESHP